MVLDWKYSRNQHRHESHGIGETPDPDPYVEKWQIKEFRKQLHFHAKEDGYDLFYWGSHLFHGKTVKQLKIRAQELEDIDQEKLDNRNGITERSSYMTIDITEEEINKMAEAFCRWELPKSIAPDDCVIDQNAHRTGTNIFTVEEAKQAVKVMFSGFLVEGWEENI